MVETVNADCEKHIASKAVKKFPLLFPTSANADLRRAARLWKDRKKHENVYEDNDHHSGSTSCISRNTAIGMKHMRLKARSGGRRKRFPWIDGIHTELGDDFDRLRCVGVKFNLTMLHLLALSIFDQTDNGIYGKGFIARSGKPQRDLMESRWVQTLCARFRIVSRSQTGKNKMRPGKNIELEKDVARHLGRLKKYFESGELEEQCISNADETHFVFNMDDGRTLGLPNDQDVRYADVTSDTEGMKMLVRISGGINARIEPPFMIFKNKTRNYRMRNVPGSVPGVAYRTGPKEWMDSLNMIEWLQERLLIEPWRMGNYASGLSITAVDTI